MEAERREARGAIRDYLKINSVRSLVRRGELSVIKAGLALHFNLVRAESCEDFPQRHTFKQAGGHEKVSAFEPPDIVASHFLSGHSFQIISRTDDISRIPNGDNLSQKDRRKSPLRSSNYLTSPVNQKVTPL